ncbi:MAG TPA: hypothetical protein DDW52_19790 [Planctomycetaceae bacterium]|nr:hypothetical protein [Planctomycetaceae bacterium]
MHTFIDHVHHLRLEEQLSVLGENVYELNHEAYDQLFATELKRLAMQTNDRMAKAQLEDLADDFKFTRYILKSVRSAGFKDDQQANQITHDIVSQLLLGSLFEFDPATIPFGKRFSVSVANAIRNVVAKQNNRQRLIPSIPISDEEGVGIPSSQIAGKNVSAVDQGVNDEFAKFVHSRLGPLGSAVLKSKLEGDEVKGLVGNVELGGPTSYRIKQMVIAIKQLAQEFFAERDDDAALAQIERALDSERKTMEKRFGKRE